MATDNRPQAEPSGSVTVGCTLPNGLTIDVDGFEPVTLAGANSSRFAEGFGMTEVPAAMWQKWSEKYKEYGPLVNGLIFAQKTDREARAQGEEAKNEKTGMEGIDPNKPGPGIKAVSAKDAD